jgi:hypothetical protein
MPTEDRHPAGMRALYPFLYSESQADLPAVLAEVRRSTADKAAEIRQLRRTVIDREAGRLAACAVAMAERFAAGSPSIGPTASSWCTNSCEAAKMIASVTRVWVTTAQVAGVLLLRCSRSGSRSSASPCSPPPRISRQKYTA